MPGIDPKVIVHRLNIDPSFRPVKQKRRTFNAERYMAINTEVDKLLKADFIREANYPEWIANVVLVKKANGNWRVCVDFTDLNKACPKDSFPLPRIDQLIDATAGHELLSFMDAYSGYNQIRMHQPDQEHTAFLTDQGATDKCQPFFRALRKGKDFSWTAECEQSFQELKTYLGRPPLLSKPQEGESLILYLAVSKGAVSSVEKLALALMIAARKLRPYFQAHTIIVPTKFPLKQILQKPDTSGRLAKWSIELGEFDILFKPRTAIKGQALADFIAEFTYQPTNLELAKELVPSPSSLWHLYVDGSSTDNCSGAGVILVSPEKVRLSCALRFRFKATNNQAEYEALLVGLRLAKEVSARHLLIYSDSQVIVNQVNSEYQAKGEKMASYLEKAKELLGQFDTVTITQIPRNENTNADALARLATGLEDSLLKTVPLEILDEPSIDKHQQVDAISDKPTWMDPIIAYLRDGTLPQDKFEARRLRYRSARYFLDKDKLRKRSFSSPSLTCLNEDQAKYVLQEVHEGVCGNHSSGRALAHKVLR
ncbi:hypothetical protein UlMin_019327 [Ulmus minor]